MLQIVGRRVEITLENEWGDRKPRAQIVAIGEAGSIDEKLLEGPFTFCISAATVEIVG